MTDSKIKGQFPEPVTNLIKRACEWRDFENGTTLNKTGGDAQDRKFAKAETRGNLMSAAERVEKSGYRP